MNRSEPLTPEERELARLLGHPAADIAPSARIDAAIAALAREPAGSEPAPRPSAPPATFTTGARPARRGWRRGLVSSLAAAASLVLVVGLAWQLRPTPPPLPAAVVPAPMAATEARDAAASPPPPPSIPAPMAAPPPSQAPVDSHARKAAAPARAAPAAARAPVASVPPPPPSPPPAPAAPAPAPATATASRVAPTASSYALEPAAVAEQAAVQAELRLHSPPQDARADAPVQASAARRPEPTAAEVVPAASAAIDGDARLPRRQWLQRIRARRADGDLDNARASLERFMQVYPEARIPRDLRPLLGD